MHLSFSRTDAMKLRENFKDKHWQLLLSLALLGNL